MVRKGNGRDGGEERVTDERRTNEAVRTFTEPLTGTYEAVVDRTIAAWDSNTELSRSFLDGTIGNLRTRAERNLDASRELVEQARRGQEAGRVLYRESANAYVGFLDSIFFHYRESVRTGAASSASTKDAGVHES